MDFRKQVTINKSSEELTFISWGADIITHFIIIGLATPLFMLSKPFRSEWQFIGNEDDQLNGYEAVFSKIINEHLHLRENIALQPIWQRAN